MVFTFLSYILKKNFDTKLLSLEKLKYLKEIEIFEI